MTRIAIDAAPVTEAPEFDLWGSVFTLRPLTRSVEAKVKETLERADAALDSDQAVEMLGEMLDHLLAPEAGKRKKASAFVVAKWQADELAIDQIETFVDKVREAAGAPPT